MADTEGYTAQSIVLAVVPKVPALMSIWGSVFIVRSVLTKLEKKNSIYQRLMLGLSFSDILASHIYFLGTWLIPKGSSGPFGDVYMAFGTDGTCSYSGFFNQLAVASPLYNVSLSIYYMLRIQRGWRDKTIKKIEPLFHLVPIAFALGTSITAAMGDMYGNVFWTCWINPDPPQPNFRHFQWSFLFAPVWVCIIIQVIVMTTLWWTMRKQERVMSQKYALEEPTELSLDSSSRDFSERTSLDFSSRDISVTDNTKPKRKSRRRSSINDEGKYSSRIAVQGSLYVLAFFITWFFPTVQRFTELADGTNYFAIQALDTILLPLQGFFNMLIYLRPKYLHYRRKYPSLPSMTIWRILRHPKEEFSLVHKFYNIRKVERLKKQRKAQQQSNNEPSSDSVDIEKGQDTLRPIPEEVQAKEVSVDVSSSGGGGGVSEIISHNIMMDCSEDGVTTQSKDVGDYQQAKDDDDDMEWSGRANRIEELQARMMIAARHQQENENAELCSEKDDGPPKATTSTTTPKRVICSIHRIQELQERMIITPQAHHQQRGKENAEELCLEKDDEPAPPPTATPKRVDMVGRIQMPSRDT